ncbi:hypothetical protein PFDG_05046 [Plasmodium falciparum Dd2]|uniref:Uncharacterized protein n=1 Tax=Plasmodium falciparum (isolate Dd2) TaxID=57267 RepID=A0A0L7M9H5_PLAF4|nr:hypothetical protein PFDG_05046 [Plasmodium falciparum Dd2]
MMLENKKGNDVMMITSNETNEENVTRDLSTKEADIYDNMYSNDSDEIKSEENDMLQNK